MGILAVIPVAAVISVIFHKYIEETLAIAMCIIIGVLFVSGIIGSFVPGYYLCIGVCSLSLAYCCFLLIKSRKSIKEYVLTPGLVAYFICVLYFVMMDRNRNVSYPDEFYHWALSIKNYIFYNHFSNIYPATDYYPTYLPGASLWGYFNCKLWSGYSAGICILGQNALFISFLLPIFRVIRKRSKIITLALTFVVLLIPIGILSDMYGVLLVDSLLGSASVYVLYMFYLRYRENSMFYTICIVAGMAALCSFKEFGIITACIDAAIIMCAVITGKIRRISDNSNINTYKLIILMLFSISIVPFTWYSYIDRTGVSNYSIEGINKTDGNHVTQILNRFSELSKTETLNDNNLGGENNSNSITNTAHTGDKNGTEELKEKYKEITISMLTQLTDSRNLGDTVHFSFVTLLSVVAFVSIVRRQYYKENKYRNTESVFSDIYLLYIVVGSVLFVVLLCFSYNLMFSDSQAREATAAARYVLPCDYMLVFLLLFLMLSECRDELLGRVIIVWLGFSLLFVNYKSLFGNLLNGNQEKTHSGIETASVRIQPCDRIFYVNQVSEKFKYSGYEFNLYIMPGVSNTSNYTLYDNDDMENGERINMGSLNAILLEGDYDYVYLDSIYILDDFIDEYGNLFADTSQIHGDELYKVEVDNKGSVVLYNM